MTADDLARKMADEVVRQADNAGWDVVVETAVLRPYAEALLALRYAANRVTNYAVDLHGNHSIYDGDYQILVEALSQADALLGER